MDILEFIPQKINELPNLNLNFGCEESGDTNEITRVAKLIMKHFGLNNKVSVVRRREIFGFTYAFYLGNDCITEYHVYTPASPEMGHGNAVMCIIDLVEEAFCEKYIDYSVEIVTMFDDAIFKIHWNYGK